MARKRRPPAPPSYSDYRRLTPDENQRAGFSRQARRYALKGRRKLTKRTKTISSRQHETLRSQQEYGVARPEIATEARRSGALPYKTAAQREAVAKATETRFLTRVARSEGKYIPPYGPSRKRPGFTLNNAAIKRYLRNR